MQASGACNFNGITIDTVEEDIAHAWVWMCEETVLTWAFLVDSLGRLQFGTIAAINIERLIAFVLQTNFFVENQTIGTQALGGNTVEAGIEFVTLCGMRILTAFVVRTDELLSICKYFTRLFEFLGKRYGNLVSTCVNRTKLKIQKKK